MKLHPDLKEFIELLNSRKVDYLVVGGHAVAFHGYPRFTGDIDFLVRPTSANAKRIVQVLKDFDFAGVGLDVSDFTRPDQVIQLGRQPNRIDLLTSISGVGFEAAARGCVAAEIDGVPVRFIGRQSLLRNKRAAGRPQDIADVAKLTGDRAKIS